MNAMRIPWLGLVALVLLAIAAVGLTQLPPGQQWPVAIQICDACVMLQAEIGNTDPSQFKRNNVRSTRIFPEQLKQTSIPRLVSGQFGAHRPLH